MSGAAGKRAGIRQLVRVSRAYSRYSSPVSFIARAFLRDAARARSGAWPICVDIGAGTSPYRAAILAAFRVESYIALDIAPTDQTSLVANARQLPLKSQSVDLVVSFDVIQHIAEPEKVLSEIRRVLRPGGCLILTFPFLYAECDVLDHQRWTMQGMRELLSRHELEPILSRRRGGWFFSLASLLNWSLQHLVPGQRVSWRQSRTWGGVIRGAAVVLLTVPTNALSWVALLVDWLIPNQGAYMGGAILAERAAPCAENLDQTAFAPR